MYSRNKRACVLSCVCLFATAWTVACHAPLSMGFSRQLEWVAHGVGCHFLLQGILPNQGSNPGLLYFRQFLYLQNHQEVVE